MYALVFPSFNICKGLLEDRQQFRMENSIKTCPKKKKKKEKKKKKKEPNNFDGKFMFLAIEGVQLWTAIGLAI